MIRPQPGAMRFSVALATVVLTVLGATPAGHAQLTLNYYFGNLHAHTSYSDGSGTPKEAYKFARDEGKLDFIAITEHNHDQAEQGAAADRRDDILIATDPTLYPKVISAAEEFNEDNRFVTFWGQEFSAISKGNHTNIFQIDDVITVDNGDYKGLYEDVLTDQVVQFNHPWDLKPDHALAYGRKSYTSITKLRNAAKKFVRTIEVINGPGTKNVTGEQAKVQGESHYKYYLTRGFLLAPSADQDNHYLTWGTLSDARTVILAPELTRTSLLAALKARRCYASTDSTLKVTFSVNSHFMGSEATATSRDLDLTYGVEDPDEPNARYKFTAVYGNTKVSDSAKDEVLPGDEGDEEHEATLTTPHTSTFVYLKIVQTAGHTTKDVALTSPVWISVP